MAYDPADWDTADDTPKQTAKRFFADGAGAHVTSADSDATTGPNALLDNSDLHFRDGTDDVARFGASGSQLGKDDEAHLVMDANSMELYDENDNQFFFAGDKRDPDTGKMRIEQGEWGDGVTDTWTMRHASDGIESVAVNGSTLTEGVDYTATLLPGFTNWTVTFPTAPALGDYIGFTYEVTTPVLAFAFGGVATGNRAVAESSSFAEGTCAHSEGSSMARGAYTHAEGSGCTADAGSAHVEGTSTNAYGEAAHAEGNKTYANGDYSHAEGDTTTAAAIASHAEGLHTFAGSQCQHVGGKYNIPDTQREYAEIIGNGNSGTLANARTLDWNGNEELQGELYLGGCTANGETPHPAVRHNTSSGGNEYYDSGTSSWVSAEKVPFHIYTGTFTANVGTNQTSYMAWTASTFRSTFNVSSGHEADCFVSFGNADVSLGSKGTITAEWWPSSYNPYGWRVRWQNQQSNNQKFSYLVIVPDSYSTV